jgi:Zn-dependent metalloprotease
MAFTDPGEIPVVRSGLLVAAAAGLIAAFGTVAPAAASPRTTTTTTVARIDSTAIDPTAHRAAMLAGPDDSFTARGEAADPDGTRHARFDRTYRGLPVVGGESILHYRPDGSLRSVTNALPQRLDLATTPALDPAKATSIALDRAGDVVRTPEPITSRLLVDAVATPRLAWDVAIPIPGSTWHIFVDAGTGEVLRTDTGLRTIAAGDSARIRGAVTGGPSSAPGAVARPLAAPPPPPGTEPPCCEIGANGSGAGYHSGNRAPLASAFQNAPAVAINYYLKDRTRGGHITRDAFDATNNSNTGTDIFSDTDNYWATGSLSNRTTAGVDAHYGAAVTWDYFKNVLGRNGIRDNGVGARSFAHYVFYFPNIGYTTQNAGWGDDCFCMMYGDGGDGLPAYTAIDVAGHEMAHGVTSATANLIYALVEAGGLNESTSDIFGTLVEFHANSLSDLADYKIGEKVFGSATPLRWMDDPDKDGQSVSCWYNGVGNLDPHYSSGVGNHFFYTLAAGSGMSSWGNSPTCGGAPAVTGIGIDKAGKIWYQALSAYMVSNETYAKARVSSINAANDLYGGVECETVKAAWSAAGVAAGASEPACVAQKTSPVLANPGNRTVKLGTAVSSQVQASHPQGAALTFAATGLPAGLSMSASGLITGTPAQVGAATATITVSDPNGSTDSVKQFWMTTGTSGCMPGSFVRNRGFEGGAASWTASANVIGEETGSADAAHGGTWRAKLGGYNAIHTDTLTQQVSLPSVNCGTVKLRFWVFVNTTESTGTVQMDTFTAKLGSTTAGTLSNLDAQRGYVEKVYTVSSPTWNSTPTLGFTSVENGTNATRFVVDDVLVEVP